MRNLHKVPQRQWRKWGARARETFNGIYANMLQNPDHFRHPKAKKEDPIFWSTTAWNSAWIAAEWVETFDRGS